MDVICSSLHRHAFLLVIDDADALYDATCMPGNLYTNSGYASFLTKVVRDPTLQGQVLWVSRVMPSCLDESYSLIGCYEVAPLAAEDAVSLLNDNGLDTDNLTFLDLLSFCAGHPGLLKIAAAKIPDSSSSNIQNFLADPLKGSIKEDKHWLKLITELSIVEQRLAIWLMLRPLSYEDIGQLKAMPSYQLHFPNALRSLQQRGLIKSDEQGYYQLHPPYLRYALASWVVQSLSRQLLPPPNTDESPNVADLRQYPLTLPTAPVFHRKWHHRYILSPLQEAIKQRYWAQKAQREWISSLIEQIPRKSANKDEPPDEGCFGFGNLLTLAASLAKTAKVPLQGLELTGCIVRCADLQNTVLRDICLADCLFNQAELPIFLQEPIQVYLAANGHAIAIGDGAGRVGYWCKEGDFFTLKHYYRFQDLKSKPTAINAITLNDNLLVINAGQQIYLWDLDEEQPVWQTSVQGSVTKLAQHQNFIAVGLSDGNVKIYDGLFNTLYSHTTNGGIVRCIAFGDTGEVLISIGLGDRIFIWDIINTPVPTFQEEIRTQGRILQSACWSRGGILRRTFRRLISQSDNIFGREGRGTSRPSGVQRLNSRCELGR